MSESVILCEGYYDRSFWRAWLTHLGCTDPGAPTPGSSRRSRVVDPWNAPVTGGQYAYLSRTAKFIRVTPCHGKAEVRTEAWNRLTQRTGKALAYLVINIDVDVSVGGPSGGRTGLRPQDVEAFVRQFDPSVVVNADGEIEIDAGATKVALVRWEATDPPTPGLPDEQTLERLVCAAVVAAYPARANAVHSWLASRSHPPAADPKEHAWSYMAGWYASHGCDAFYANLWQDAAVVAELEARLRASNAWRVAETLAS
jgi:hypothetical protein